MEDVNISKYRAQVVRAGSTPASPGFVVSEGQNPVDPSGSGQNHLPVTIATAATGLSITESQVLGGAGTVGQYIRGDGSLADFPATTGGGSSVSYYLNGSVSQGTIGGVAYKELNRTPVFGAGTDISINADGYIASFITDALDPNKLLIPGGNWNFETYFSASSSGGSPSFYVELYKYDGTTFTLLATSSSAPELIAFGTNLNPYFSTLAVPETVLALTDRLAVRFYVTHSGRTITLHTENGHLCQVITTFTTGLTALNGLTSQVQFFAVGTSGTDFAISSASDTHTFNLPTASATNRGALSSADWSTFNGKQNALTNPVTGTGTTNTLPKFTGASTIGNSLFTDNGTNGAFGGANYSSGTDVRTFNISAPLYAGLAFWANNVLTGDIFGYSVTGNLLINADPTNVFSGTKIGLGIDGTERLAIFSNGNVSIANSPTDNGAKFQVAGTATISGDLGVNRIPSSGYKVDIQGNTGLRILDNDVLRSIILTPPTSAGAAANVESSSANGLNLNSSNASGNVNILTAGSARLSVYNDGNVTISNTPTNSGFKLYVAAPSTAIAAFEGATNGYVDINDGTVNSRLQNTSQGFLIGTVNSHNLNLRTNNTIRLTINASTGAAIFSSTLRATEITAAMPSGNGALYINNSSLSNKNWTFIPNTSSSETDLLLFYTGSGAGTRMTITSGGNVGIGISPDVKFQVNDGTNINLGIKVGQTNSSAVMLNAFNNGASANIPLEFRASSYNFTLGNVGILTPTANGRLAIRAQQSDIPSLLFQNGLGGPSTAISNYESAAQTFSLIGTNLYINSGAGFSRFDTSKQSSGVAFDEGILIFCTGPTGSTASNRMSINSTGVVTIANLGTGTVTSTAGVLSSVSDSSYKIDDGFIDSAIEKVLNLKPRYFYWNEKSGLPTDKRQLGFYAQEVNQALGEEAANTPQNENTSWGITDRSMIAMLTKAIQELKQEIDTLKN